MKNLITILAVACIIAGCAIGSFSSIAIADYGAIALEAFGFTVLVIKTIKNAKENTMTTIITTVAGLVALIIGLLAVKKKNA